MTPAAFLQKHRDTLILITLGLAALLIRIWGSWSISFSNDELSALTRLDYASLRDLIEKGIRPDGHPAATQIFLYYWTSFVGLDEFWVRLPFVLFSTFSVLLFFSFARLVYNKEAALYAAVLLAFSVLYIINGRLARPYSMGVFFITMQLLALGKLHKQSSGKWWFLFIIAADLAAFTHHFAALTAAVIAMLSPLLLTRKQLLFWLISSIAAILLYLPHLGITLQQLSLGGVGQWLGKPDAVFILKHLFYLINKSWLIAVPGLLVLLYLLFSGKPARIPNHTNVFLLLVLVLPAATGYFYSILINPVLQHSVLLFSAPAFFLLLAIALDVFKKGTWFISFGLASLMLIGLIGHPFFSNGMYGDFKGAAAREVRWTEDKTLSGNTIHLLNINHPSYLSFYLPADFVLKADIDQVSSREDLTKVSNLLHNKPASYLIFHNLRPEIPEVYDLILWQYPFVIEDYRTPGSRSTLFSKKGKGKAVAAPVTKSSLLEAQMRSPDSVFIQTEEFSLNHVLTLENIKPQALGRVSVEFKSSHILPHELVAVTEDKEGNMINWFGMKLEHFRHEEEWSKAFLRFSISGRKIERVKVYIWNPDPSFRQGIQYKKLGIDIFDVGNGQGMNLLEIP
jgi:hypothetical protein